MHNSQQVFFEEDMGTFCSLSFPSSCSGETESVQTASILPSRTQGRSPRCFWSSSCCLLFPWPSQQQLLSGACSSVWGIWRSKAGRRRRDPPSRRPMVRRPQTDEWLLLLVGGVLVLVEVSVIEVCCRQSFMKRQRLEAHPAILNRTQSRIRD